MSFYCKGFESESAYRNIDIQHIRAWRQGRMDGLVMVNMTHLVRLGPCIVLIFQGKLSTMWKVVFIWEFILTLYIKRTLSDIWTQMSNIMVYIYYWRAKMLSTHIITRERKTVNYIRNMKWVLTFGSRNDNMTFSFSRSPLVELSHLYLEYKQNGCWRRW